MITKQQIEYLFLAESGLSAAEIARRTGKNPSTISRALRRAKNKTCPFASDCTKCPLPDCAIDERYAFMLNRKV